MSKLLAISINLSLIDKTRIITHDKDGKKFENGAQYYDVIVSVNDEANEYKQTCSIKEGRTKEEREAGLKDNYLGNGITIWDSEKPAGGSGGPSDEDRAANSKEDSSDDLPF